MVATLGSVEVRAVLAPELDGDAAHAMSRALNDRLLGALPDAFEPLAEIDPGAVWVLREVHVRARLEGVGDDVCLLARRVADALAQGIAAAVRQGPGPEAMRFAGRAEYAAAYAAARIAGIAGGWVFARLHPVDALPVTDALVAAARVVDADPIAVVLAFAGQPGWQRMVDAATPAEAGRLVQAIRAATAPPPGDPGSSGPPLLPSSAGLSPGGLRTLGPVGLLSLIGRAVRVYGARTEVLRGVVGVQPEPPAGGWAARSYDEPPPTPTRGPHDREPGVMSLPPAADADDPPQALESGEAFWAPGAVAFLLLPDLAELAGDSALAALHPDAALARAGILRAVLGPAVAADDAGLHLAAGLDPVGEPCDGAPRIAPDGFAESVTGLADAIAADEVLGWRHGGDADWVAQTGPLPPAVETLAIALLRRFARHLPGFGRSAAGYLVPRVLVPGGRIRLDDQLIEAQLPRAPLGVLLAMARLDAFVTSVAWVPVPFAVTHEDPP